ncbi:hypothetical protein VD659_14950 [Herbiconiux sp. 11R-BC]|uniref:hypothetical protein n=1 Tax=Herbiconiux sp. 11R-BC TaxID=3111637 RepID=UPI003C02A608
MPDGSEFVLSYVEVIGDSIVLRLHLNDARAIRRFTGPLLGLRDHHGREFEWRSSASGGLIPGEVLHEFADTSSERVRSIELFLRSSDFTLGFVELA